MNKSVFLLVISFFLISCNQKSKSEKKQTINTADIVDSLTNELAGIYNEGFMKGFSVAIVSKDSVLYENGFGYSNVNKKESYTINTVQNIASVSKTLIGLALLKAQEMGKLKLDDPIDKYLPFEVNNPYNPDETITIRHLATHTSTILDSDLYGEKSYILNDANDYELMQTIPGFEDFNRPDAMMTLKDFLKNFLSVEGAWYQKGNYLNKKPGELYEYSNVGATLAAFILEIATNKAYTEFTTQHILEPLKMNASGWTFNDIDMTKHTKLYTLTGKEIPLYSLVTYPDGGLITSMSDMSKYLSELIKGYSGEGELLSKESYTTIFSKLLTESNFEEQDTDRPFDDEYNSGVFMGHTPIGYIGHTGGDPGVSTFMFFNPKTKIGRLLFVNTDLDEKGAKQFYAIWNKLGDYEMKLTEKAEQ